MTDTKKLYQSWKRIGKSPEHYCEHKKLLCDLTEVIIEDDICRPCDGYDAHCKYYLRRDE